MKIPTRKTDAVGSLVSAQPATTAVAATPATERTSRPTSRLGQRGQVVIPKQIRERLGLGLNTELEFDEQDGVITMRPKKDMVAFRKHMEKWKGALAGELQRDGFKDVDDYMKFIRGR